MALLQGHFGSVLNFRNSFFIKPTRINNISSFSFKPIANGIAKISSELGNNITRRSANYKPSIWNFDYIQSLTSKYGSEMYFMQASELKEEVKLMVERVHDFPLAQLELVDMLQRLGLSYHFESEIKLILQGIYTQSSCNNTWKIDNIYATALEFRLLRQHGYHVPQEVFNAFKDVKRNFKAFIGDDIIGMLSLYEASFHLLEGEGVLEEAKEFSTKHLEAYINKYKKRPNEEDVYALVSHALELPLRWRMLRLEARWFIDVYEKGPNMNPILLEFAKLDFNIVQSRHQDDLKQVSMWWTKSGLGEELKFARDRLMENFLWAVGVLYEPQFGYYRTMLARLGSLITVIDDIYDLYGTLDELELFTSVVTRWDMSGLDQLPNYMKSCFLTLDGSVNEMAFDVLKEKSFHSIEYLRKTWADLCKSYLVEAKWYYSGYTPTTDEYIENAWISISGPLILSHVYIFVTNPINEGDLEFLEDNPEIIRLPSTILRLADDLGTSSDELKRGDVPKSIQCYMNEAGVTEEEAREHIKFLISKSWKQMNKAVFNNSPFCETFIKVAMNLGRMAQCMYQHGDGHGVQDCKTKNRVLGLLINPIGL